MPMIRKILNVSVLVAVVALGACAARDVPVGVNDPNEERNRKIHAFNKRVDDGVLRPLSSGYVGGVPAPVQKGVGNFAGNLSTPGYFVNDVLQGNIDDAAHNFVRFIFNTTIGLGGLFDPATSWGLHERSSDFGETLHVWGAPEGAYMELPFLGPSTQRDAAGKVVDIFTNPLSYVIPAPEKYGMPVVKGFSGVGARYRYRELVDSILYDSADSYAQARLLYLDARRFQLSGSSSGPNAGDVDPYADPTGIDPYAD